MPHLFIFFLRLPLGGVLIRHPKDRDFSVFRTWSAGVVLHYFFLEGASQSLKLSSSPPHFISLRKYLKSIRLSQTMFKKCL